MLSSAYRQPQTIENAQEALTLLSQSFSIYPHPDEVRDPAPDEWSEYLLKYPQYADSKLDLAAHTFAASRESVDGLSEPLQALAASLICISFNEQELMEIAEI